MKFRGNAVQGESRVGFARIRNWYAPQAALANEFQFTRFLIIRLLGLCYTMAFLVFVNQAPGLIGENGILPADRFFNLVALNHDGVANAFWKLPSLFWFWHTDTFMLTMGWIGLAIAIAVLCGYANSLMLLVLWVLQMSIQNMGQIFWGYGWESQLLETGFLAIFLVAFLDGRPFPKSRPSRIVIILYCWLAARIMIGAGLIKLRGDPVWSWSELTALQYHFETQPIPNGLSWYFHHLPDTILKAGVAFNHVVEIYVPFLLLLPRSIRNLAGCLMVSLQVVLIFSGNLSFLNYLTIIPCLACIDDRFYRYLLPERWWVRIREAKLPGKLGLKEKITMGVRVALLLLVAFLSIAPVNNLFSPQQRMNSSFDPLRLVNTYGAFGSVGKVRGEIVVEGTDAIDLRAPNVEWREYKFYGKPGDPAQRAPFMSPYHHRLDWEIWFAALGSIKGELWPAYFAARLLENEPAVLALLPENPFPAAPPRAIRMTRYTYRFTTPEERAATGDWWVREDPQYYFGPVTLDNLQFQEMLRKYKWPGRR